MNTEAYHGVEGAARCVCVSSPINQARTLKLLELTRLRTPPGASARQCSALLSDRHTRGSCLRKNPVVA